MPETAVPNAVSPSQVTRGSARRVIAATWLIGAGALLVLFVAQTLGSRLDGFESAAWSWFLPTISPVTALVVAGFVAEATEGGTENRVVDHFFVRVAVVLCALYLLLLAITIIIPSLGTESPIKSWETANLYLGPVQGFVVAALGVYFTKSHPGKGS